MRKIEQSEMSEPVKTDRGSATGRRAWAILLLVWLPLALGYPLAASLMSENRLGGAFFGLRSAAIAGLLIVAVWWLTGRLHWPDRPDPRFYLAHLGAALLYAGTWWIAAVTLAGLSSPAPVGTYIYEFATGPYMAWDIMLGVVTYGLVAGVSYAIRAGERERAVQIRAAEADALATRAQLTALQAQLNPHFLFNTLHSLSVLIRRDPGVAEDALDRLGELLRYALDQGRREQVLLRDEWRFVESYLAIEGIRLGERLCVQSDVDDAALGHAAPPFCLQPLVENAIRHGLDPKPPGGRLWIRLAREPDRLVLRVRDDGAGARLSEEILPESVTGSGLGLRALQQRLDSWEDGPGRLEIESAPGEGFTATVTLPLSDARGPERLVESRSRDEAENTSAQHV
jgi:two-component system LytT family sensor kinase